ncbi:MAG: transcriptional repressor [Deltaproteobacteria bacterium]|nr:transcriptional repressor [Deltaproteobacteria bacterium]
MKIDIGRYRGLGIKMTPQRIAILEFLEGNLKHPTADDIFKAIKKKYPSVSFATVYNTVEALKTKGLLCEVNIDRDRRHYETRCEPHNHVICTSCGRIMDVDADFSNALKVNEDELMGFKVSSRQVNFFGVCASCMEKNKKRGGI